MDIRESLLEIAFNEDDSPRKRSIIIEGIFAKMMSYHLEKQGRSYIQNYRSGTSFRRYLWDGFVSDGFDSYKGDTLFEIRNFFSYQTLDSFLNKVSLFISDGGKIDNIIIVALTISESLKEELLKRIRPMSNRVKIVIWNLDNVVDLFEQYPDYFEQVYNDLDRHYISNLVGEVVNNKPTTIKDSQKNLIREIQNKYEKDDLTLVLGAGASMDAKIASWDELLSKLFVSFVDREMQSYGISISKVQREKLANDIKNNHSGSPLIQAGLIKKGLKEDFEDVVREILYENSVDSSKLLKSIGQLCVPRRGKIGIKAIVNYNFDDLIEKQLNYLNLEYTSIFGGRMIAKENTLGIYHVHGFLPQNKDEYENLSESKLIFSEDGYHNLMLDLYNWSNLTQLHYLTESTCLFIGLSMTDPNMRRLLDVAAKRNPDDKPRHYAILRRNTFSGRKTDEMKTFVNINEKIEEEYFADLGVNVLWVNDFEEIPGILDQIKCKK